jgi:hypothetical protein
MSLGILGGEIPLCTHKQALYTHFLGLTNVSVYSFGYVGGMYIRTLLVYCSAGLAVCSTP